MASGVRTQHSHLFFCFWPTGSHARTHSTQVQTGRFQGTIASSQALHRARVADEACRVLTRVRQVLNDGMRGSRRCERRTDRDGLGFEDGKWTSVHPTHVCHVADDRLDEKRTQEMVDVLADGMALIFQGPWSPTATPSQPASQPSARPRIPSTHVRTLASRTPSYTQAPQVSGLAQNACLLYWNAVLSVLCHFICCGWLGPSSTHS